MTLRLHARSAHTRDTQRPYVPNMSTIAQRSEAAIGSDAMRAAVDVTPPKTARPAILDLRNTTFSDTG